MNKPRKSRATQALTVRGRGPGKPTVASNPGIKHARRLAANGWSLASIADALGVTVPTLREMRKRQPALQEALDVGHGDLESELAGILLQQARDGNTIAAIYLSKAKLGWRDTGPATGANKPTLAVQINLPASMSEEEYRRSLGQLQPPLIALAAPEDHNDE